jgi:hypothetical protein
MGRLSTEFKIAIAKVTGAEEMPQITVFEGKVSRWFGVEI